ncbi:MAG: cytochrome c biogenesis heme-transporting ATPase CcmA [Burkholderiaceae bacterium]|nr:cytochrome c biogenesis heme-transporting ATPase CcmA [Burkholderiaceae bacterium]
MTPSDAAAGLETRALACAAGLRTLFSALDLRIAPGQWTMLVGPNGSGKSTLLRTIAGLARPLAGQILWHGAPRRVNDAEWRAQCVYQGHAPGWKDAFDVRENLSMQLAIDGLPASADTLQAAIERVGLARQSRLPFARLSAGQRRRVSLARLSCSHARKLWLLDEPGTALDADALNLLGRLIDAHLREGGLALIATHQPLPCAAIPTRLSLDDPRS